jgi:hypothetical protein
MANGHTAALGGENSPLRLAQRIQRLEQSAERAEGQRKEELLAEAGRHRQALADLRAALESVGA